MTTAPSRRDRVVAVTPLSIGSTTGEPAAEQGLRPTDYPRFAEFLVSFFAAAAAYPQGGAPAQHYGADPQGRRTRTGGMTVQPSTSGGLAALAASIHP
jgi:hypothetical protein